ncbi:MAG: glycosyltransferase family 39 protein [Phycisphaerales bacterium]|nr:MAG: glycosyltransferase family 39 protein [Phycisphaerales bacterium]
MPSPPCKAAEPASTRRREWLAVAVILLVGSVLRGMYLRENVAKPEFTVPGVDAGFHDYWARGLAFGEWVPPHHYVDPKLREHAYLRPPGYPYFLALIYRVAGEGYVAPRVVNMVLGLASCLLAYWFARRWFGRTVALLSVACTSLYWAFIYFEGELHAPALLILLLWLMLAAMGLWRDRPRLARAVVAGVLLGAAALVRPNVLVFAAVALAWGCWVAARRRYGRRVLVDGLGFVFGLAIAVAPATIRNYTVSGEFVLISSNAGINLYIGNNPQADGRVAMVIPGLGPFGTCYDYPALVRNLEHKLGRELTDSQVSSYFASEALGFIRANPARTISLTVNKAIMFWSPREISHNKMIDCERMDSGALRAIPLDFGLVLGLFVLGLVRFVHRWGARSEQDPCVIRVEDSRCWEMLVLVLLLIVTFFLSLLPFFLAARYRVPIVPFLIVVGTYGLEGVMAAARARGGLRVGVAGFVWLVACVFFGRMPEPHPYDWAKWHSDRGAACLFGGRLDQSIREYRRALELNPGFTDAHYNLAMVMQRQGKLEEALAEARRFVESQPDRTSGYRLLAELLIQAGRYEEAGDVLERGLALPMMDPFLMAQAAKFLARCPQPRLRDEEEALRLARRACELTDNEWPEPLAALAEAHAALGQAAEASRAASEALRLAEAQGKTELVEEMRQMLERLGGQMNAPE